MVYAVCSQPLPPPPPTYQNSDKLNANKAKHRINKICQGCTALCYPFAVCFFVAYSGCRQRWTQGGCSGTVLHPLVLPLRSLADPCTLETLEPRLPHSSHGLQVCRVPRSAGDSSSKGAASFCTSSLPTPCLPISPHWPEAAARRRNLPVCLPHTATVLS